MKLKLHLLLFYPSTWYICESFLFQIEIEGIWVDYWGVQRVCCPPLKLLGDPPPAPLFLRLCIVIVHVNIFQLQEPDTDGDG